MATGKYHIRWMAERLERQIEREANRRLDRSAQLLRTAVVKRISISSRDSGPSLPGEPPHADTGRLRNSIFVGTPADLRRLVGTNLKYGLWLEVGTQATVTIRPKNAAALLIPVKPSSIAQSRKRKGKWQVLLVGQTKWRSAVKKGKKFFIFSKRAVRGPIKARPYLRPTFEETQPEIAAILTAPMNLGT